VAGDPARGKFITFEGGEGAGKSTQARLLKERLEARGIRAVLTREPGGSPGAEQIRKLLVEGEPERWTPMTETLLFLAARSDHVAKLITPALDDGSWVICDRFVDSTLVYQGVARGLGLERVRALQTAALGEIAPDLTFILDLAPDAGLARTRDRSGAETRFERFAAEFHARLRTAFRDIAAEEPGRCVIVDAAASRDAVASEIWRNVMERVTP
jgi:dTMP kinase